MRCIIRYILNTVSTPRPHSFQNYTDYFKCIAAKGEDFAPCKQFKRAYNSLCPSASHVTSLLCHHSLVHLFDALYVHRRMGE